MGKVGNKAMGLLRKERSGRSFYLGWWQDIIQKKKKKKRINENNSKSDRAAQEIKALTPKMFLQFLPISYSFLSFIIIINYYYIPPSPPQIIII